MGAAGASAGLAGWLARGGGSASRSEPGSPVYRLEVEVRRERAGLGGHCTRDRAAFALPELERLPQSAGAAAIHCKNLTGGGVTPRSHASPHFGGGRRSAACSAEPA